MKINLNVLGVGMVKNGCGRSCGETYSWMCLKNKQMELTDFLQIDTDSQKLKAGQKSFGWTLSEMDVGSLVTRL